MAKYTIDIQADASILFKLLKLKQLENDLNKYLPLNTYLKKQDDISEIVFALSALPEFSLSKKTEKTKFQAGGKKIIFQTNIEPEVIKQADELDLLELFSDIFIQFFEETKLNVLNKDKLIADYIDNFLTEK